MFIHGPPEPVFNSTDLDLHLVEMPLGASSGFLMAETLGELGTEVDVPGADGLVGDRDSTLKEQFLDISVAQGEAVTEPNGIPDHGERKSVARKFLITQHRVTLPHQLARTS